MGLLGPMMILGHAYHSSLGAAWACDDVRTGKPPKTGGFLGLWWYEDRKATQDWVLPGPVIIFLLIEDY